MEIALHLEKTAETKTLNFSGKTVQELLTQLKLNPETVLVVRNNEVLTSDISLRNKDTLQILSVISGG